MLTSEMPLSTDDALESLSAGFVSSAAPSAPKKTDPKAVTVDAVDAKSAGFSNLTPRPYQQKQQTTTLPSNINKSPAPPADKRAKIEVPETSSLAAGKTSAQPEKPKTNVLESSSPTDPFSALGDMLGKPEPPKKQPDLKPGATVDHKKMMPEKAVLVGEREDTLPPNYRFKEEDLKKYPAPPKEPSLGTDEALDILSGGFDSPTAPHIPEPPVCVGGDPPPYKPVDDFDLVLEDDIVAPSSATQVKSAVTGPTHVGRQVSEDFALDALSDTLADTKPKPEPTPVSPKSVVKEQVVISEKGVRVGEREDTLPPNYRFSEEDLKKYPAPAKEPSLGTDEALDILSGGFDSPTAPHIPKPPVCVAGDPPRYKPVDDFDLVLEDDIVAPSSASKVQSAVNVPTQVGRQFSEDSALDALSDTLADTKPKPEPTPLSPKSVVKEVDIVEEKVSKPGERDDSLPPDHRFSEADKKAFEEAKKCAKPKQESMDDAAALDLLSSDLSSAPSVKASAPGTRTFTPEPVPPTHTAPGQALEELAGKLIPNLDKAKESKGKKQSGEESAVENLSAQLSSKDVVPSSSTKGGKR